MNAAFIICSQSQDRAPPGSRWLQGSDREVTWCDLIIHLIQQDRHRTCQLRQVVDELNDENRATKKST
uniref:Uncharacterized protein n=1 Tax=Panagrellus redivivus TaxID=6233 RepID=A0A7E4WAP8_PANRE